MKVFAHQHHVYEDLARHRTYTFNPGQVLDCPDEVGRLVTRAHPQKLCDVSNEEHPEKHRCKWTKLGQQATQELRDRELREFQQKAQEVMPSNWSHTRRRQHRQLRHRSLVARKGAA